jgi:hypothetical protein
VRDSLDEALDWALDKGRELLEAVVRVAEDIGSRLRDVIDWAKAVGDEALDLLAEVWVRLGNSVSYLLTWVAKDLIPGLASIVTGLLRAGLAVVEIVAWAVGKAITAVIAVIQAALAAGVTLVSLLAAIALQPQNAGSLFMQAMRDLGKTVKEILEPAFTLSDADKRYIVQALRDAGTGLQECLDGLLEVAGGGFFAVVAIVLEVFGVFRSLTAGERQRAKLVYKNSLPLDDIQVFEGSFVAWAAANNTGGDTGVVTMRIIHFPDSYSDTDSTQEGWMIHELMHVWQGEHVGPVYMAHALIGQATDGYEYGGAAALQAHVAEGLDAFNPEQQGEIVKDFYNLKKAGTATTDYDPYIAEVQAA